MKSRYRGWIQIVGCVALAVVPPWAAAAAQAGMLASLEERIPTLMEQGDIDQTKLAYRKAALFAKPGNAEPFLTLTDFYESIGDTANAVTALRHAYTITPKDQQIHDRLRRYGIVPGPTATLPIERESRR